MKHRLESERFEARLSAENKNLLKYAADLVGRSLTDFVVNSAYEAAARVIKEREQISLSLKDRDVLIQSLLNPPAPSDVLLNAAKKYNKDVVSK